MRAAFAYLTVFGGPLARPANWRTAAAYPLVGALIGLVWIVLGRLVATNLALGPAVAAASIFIVDAILTRALHLDGLASVVDGASGADEPEHAVRLMREADVAVPGLVALVGVALLRFGLFVPLAAPTGPVLWGLVPLVSLWLLAPAAAGRLVMVLCYGLVPLRADEPAGPISSVPPPSAVAAATVVTLLAAAPGGVRGLLAVTVAVAVGVACCAWWRRRFNALVAEAPAAACLVAETAALAALLAGS